MLDGDVAMTLGRLLHDELGVTTGLLVVDGLALRDFDYIDIGRVRHPSRTVPVTIKSLVFSEDPRHAPRGRARPRRVPTFAARCPTKSWRSAVDRHHLARLDGSGRVAGGRALGRRRRDCSRAPGDACHSGADMVVWSDH